MRIKSQLLLALFFLSSSILLAQPYGNEWIDYSKTYHKIKITRDGVYRIPFNTLNNISGLNLATVRGSDFVLYNLGEAVPIYVSTNNFFGQNDYIEFYGKKNDGTFDRNLYANPDLEQPNPYYSLFNDTAVYFLAWQVATTKNFINLNNDLTNLPLKETTCKQTVVEQLISEFNGGKTYTNQNYLKALFEEGEGFQGVRSTFSLGSPFSMTISTPGLVNSGNFEIKFAFSSNNSVPHNNSIKLNNVALFDTSFNNYKFFAKTFIQPQSILQASNQLTFSSNVSGSASSVAFGQITYNRDFNFTGLTTNLFSINGSIGAKYIEIIGLDAQSTLPILYDLTNNARIVGSSALQFKLPSAPASQERTLYLFSEATISEISITEPINFINYFNTVNQCNFCIISEKRLFNDGNGVDWVGEYKKYRQTNAGGNWITQIINIDQLYDQYAYGIRKHPLAIRNWSRSATDAWVTKPEYLFIIGKGRIYDKMRFGQQAQGSPYEQCLVPTFGNNGGDRGGSDNLLTAPNTSTIVSAFPVGRLAATDGNQVRIYLQKIKDFEDNQNKKGDPYQTIANKLWMKEILHLGGGTSQSEQTQFALRLNDYKESIACEYFGAEVSTVLKTSTSIIQTGSSNLIESKINSGVSLLTFYGHSSPGSFDLTIDDPNNYSNFKKYPLIFSMGCFTGNIFIPSPGISEKYVFAENKGSIAFLSSATLSDASGLNIYATELYKNFGFDNYNKSIGKIIIQTNTDLVLNHAGNERAQIVAEELVLHGDPSIIMNTHEKPDYDLEPQMISFIPSIVNVQDPDFKMRIIVPNLGKAVVVSDSIVLSVDRVFPAGGSLRYEKKVPAPCFVDTIDIVIPTGGANAFGLNNFIIKIEDEDKIDELSETNNQLGVSINILSDDVFPIYPYDFAIVNTDTVTLAASTANSFAALRTYKIEIDTTELFNSAFKKSGSVSMTGGLWKWKVPFNFSNIFGTNSDSTVYYWRVGKDTSVHGPNSTFHNSSFVYLPNDSPGWNQSHFFQWKKDEFQNLVLDNNRDFKFVGDTKNVSVITGACAGVNATVNDCQKIGYALNGGVKDRLVCGGRGFRSGLSVAVFDPLTGRPWVSKLSDVISDPCSGILINQVYKNVHCNPGTARDFEIFNFPIPSIVDASCGNNVWQQRFVDFINLIPNDHYILIYSASIDREIGYNQFTPGMVNVLNSLGSQRIALLQTANQFTPWAFFCQKGNQNFQPQEQVGVLSQQLEFNALFDVQWYQGDMKSTLIGPAFKWKNLFWQSAAVEPNGRDINTIDIIGVKANKTETELFSNITTSPFDLSGIDANLYPYIRLKIDTRDDTARTPTQLNYWKVVHDIVPEAALAPNIFLEFDTAIALGEDLNLKVAIENVSPVDMDSLLVKYSIVSNGNQANITYARYDSLRAGQNYNLNYRFNTNCNCLNDINSLIVEANPDEDQREQFHYNNIGILQFNVDGDRQNPLLDVTFDGVHILNGDIVSAQPEILVKLKDENKYLALDDTSLIKVFLKYPDGRIEQQAYNQGYMLFTPATPSQLSRKNEAQILLTRTFPTDGIYELQVQATDRSRNISGNYGDPTIGVDFRIAFEVINKQMITNVLNYPNPFTTATKFIFTLTGSDLPTYMKIQIMTITGKIVREVEMDELGPLRIGRNITEFTWNGTDQYGDRLANGLYFYRVVASMNGKQLEKLETSADKYFKSGLGKMYMVK